MLRTIYSTANIPLGRRVAAMGCTLEHAFPVDYEPCHRDLLALLDAWMPPELPKPLAA